MGREVDQTAAARQAAIRAAAANVRDTAAAAEVVVRESPMSPERNLAARAAHEAAKKDYARLLRANEDFIRASRAAEDRLDGGPPWDDKFSPSELLEEADRPKP